MQKKLVTTNADSILKEVAILMRQRRVGSALVKDGEEFIGIVTERDMLTKSIAKGLDPNTTKVRDIMSKPLLTIDMNKPVIEAVQMMNQKHIRRVPVSLKGNIVGILSQRDIQARAFNLFRSLI